MGKDYDDSKMNIIKSIRVDEFEGCKLPIYVELFTYDGGKPRMRICRIELNADGSEKFKKYIRIGNPEMVAKFILALEETNDEFKTLLVNK